MAPRHGIGWACDHGRSLATCCHCLCSKPTTGITILTFLCVRASCPFVSYNSSPRKHDDVEGSFQEQHRSSPRQFGKHRAKIRHLDGVAFELSTASTMWPSLDRAFIIRGEPLQHRPRQYCHLEKARALPPSVCTALAGLYTTALLMCTQAFPVDASHLFLVPAAIQPFTKWLSRSLDVVIVG